MDYPGRIYVRDGDRIRSVNQPIVIYNWIPESETSLLLTLPEKAVGIFSYLFLTIGCLLMIFQIALASVQHAIIPSLFGSGIWVGLLSIMAGVIGQSALRKKKMENFLDFMVASAVVNMMSALVVILNTIGFEMYSRLCAYGNAKQLIGNCGGFVIALQSTLIFLNVFLFVLSTCCGGYICRTLDTSFQTQGPPLIIHYKNEFTGEQLMVDEAPKIKEQATKSGE